MIEIILKVGILLTGILIIQTTYNTILYRQPKNLARIATVGNVTLVTTVVAAALWWCVNWLDKIPYLNNFIIAVDSPFKAFWNYLPKIYLLIWFVIPIVLVWIIFLFKGGIAYQKIKKEYFKFINSDSSKSESNSHISTPPPVELKGDIKPKKEDKEHVVIRFKAKEPPKKYFLENVKTKSFEHRTVKGITRVLPCELVIGKTLQGYVAIYETNQGYKKLKKIFSENSIDITDLRAQPSIVLFTQSKVQCFGLKDYLRRIKAGEKVYGS